MITFGIIEDIWAVEVASKDVKKFVSSGLILFAYFKSPTHIRRLFECVKTVRSSDGHPKETGGFL